MRVAAEFIKTHAEFSSIRYDDADCDGHCLAEELANQAEMMDVKIEKSETT